MPGLQLPGLHTQLGDSLGKPAIRVEVSHVVLNNAATCSVTKRPIPLKLTETLHPFSPRKCTAPSRADSWARSCGTAVIQQKHCCVFMSWLPIMWETQELSSYSPVSWMSSVSQSCVRFSPHQRRRTCARTHTQPASNPCWLQGQQHYKSTQRQAQFQILWHTSCSLLQTVLNLGELFNGYFPWRASQAVHVSLPLALWCLLSHSKVPCTPKAAPAQEAAPLLARSSKTRNISRSITVQFHVSVRLCAYFNTLICMHTELWRLCRHKYTTGTLSLRNRVKGNRSKEQVYN